MVLLKGAHYHVVLVSIPNKQNFGFKTIQGLKLYEEIQYNQKSREDSNTVI